MLQTDTAPRSVMTPRARLMELVDGYLSTQLIHTAVRLGIPELVAGGSCTTEQIAETLGIDADRVWRVMRGLATIGILDEQGDRSFRLTELGALLDPHSPGSLAGPARVRGELYAPAAALLADALLSGEVPFERQSGSDFFTYAQQDHEVCRVFQASMTARSHFEADALVRNYDFGRFRRIVDVGGGAGILLETVLDSATGVEGTLFDLPVVTDMARARLTSRPNGDRITLEPGDFFSDLLPPGDCYLLSRILHDWNDEDAVQILRSVRNAIEPDGTLLLVESVLPKRAVDDPAAIRLDMVMLIMLRGKERTVAAFGALLERAGFSLESAASCGPQSGVSVIEARPV